MTIVGIDCATEPERTGVAVVRFEPGAIGEVVACFFPKNFEQLAAQIAAAPRGPDNPLLLAMDAPLGWPAPFADALQGHRAGAPFPGQAHSLFRRATDLEIRRRFQKLPLEVAADRIARAAKAALDLLALLGERCGEEVALAWDFRRLPRLGAIEVYPAATLISRRLRARGYKKSPDAEGRAVIARALATEVRADAAIFAEATQHADLLDALICALAGIDFVEGRAVAPSSGSLPVAEREGWIWAADPR